MTAGRHGFFGGLSLPGRKAAGEAPIRTCPVPVSFWVPLLQHAGEMLEVQVHPGDRVAENAVLGFSPGLAGSVVHAPCPAEVLGIALRPLAQAPQFEVQHVQLKHDPDGPRRLLPALDPAACDVDTLLERIAEAGVVGLGGAAFPTAEKLAVRRDWLLLNGAECEPYTACDERLMRERAGLVVAAADLLQRLSEADRVVIAVEDRMVEACAALRAALAASGSSTGLAVLPSRYPQGGERQLIQAVTGLQVPRGGLPRDIGVAVVNVATACAVLQAIQGQPLTRRLVSVAGQGIASPGVFEVAIGTSIADLVSAAGGYTPQARRLLLGGPMMGIALPHDGFSLGKPTHAVLVLGDGETVDSGPEMPCIRCGECAAVCPSRLLPQQLLAFGRSQQWERTREHGLLECIECGCCDLACPSQIPLTRQFRDDKATLRQQDLERQQALEARLRFEAREARMARERALRTAGQTGDQRSHTARAAAQEALARARARRAGRDGKPE